jgi:hypothetical protein
MNWHLDVLWQKDYFSSQSSKQAYHLSGFQPDSPVLECAVRVADETSNRTIECPVLAQIIWFELYFNHKIFKSMFISCAHFSCYQGFWYNIACSKTFYGFNALLLIQNLKEEINNFNLKCSFFCNSVKNNNEILKNEKSNTKYTFKLIK